MSQGDWYPPALGRSLECGFVAEFETWFDRIEQQRQLMPEGKSQLRQFGFDKDDLQWLQHQMAIRVCRQQIKIVRRSARIAHRSATYAFRYHTELGRLLRYMDQGHVKPWMLRSSVQEMERLRGLVGQAWNSG